MSDGEPTEAEIEKAVRAAATELAGHTWEDGPVLWAILRGYMRSNAEEAALDALNLAAEVALGITHSTVCDPPDTPCVRCRLEKAEQDLRALRDPSLT